MYLIFFPNPPWPHPSGSIHLVHFTTVMTSWEATLFLPISHIYRGWNERKWLLSTASERTYKTFQSLQVYTVFFKASCWLEAPRKILYVAKRKAMRGDGKAPEPCRLQGSWQHLCVDIDIWQRQVLVNSKVQACLMKQDKVACLLDARGVP